MGMSCYGFLVLPMYLFFIQLKLLNEIELSSAKVLNLWYLFYHMQNPH